MFDTHKVCELIELIDLIFYVLFCVAKVRTFLLRLFLKCFLDFNFCSKGVSYLFKNFQICLKLLYKYCIYQGFIVLSQYKNL